MNKKILILVVLAIVLLIIGAFTKKENIMEENTKGNEVITTESGLQYEIIKMGDGEKPSAVNTVEVHYHGTLEDGSVFDSSVERGEKISFGLNQVIPGWTEGLQLMPIGSKFKFTIPAELAWLKWQLLAGSSLSRR